jgi:branched-chain amino acid transport system permease protein
MLALGWGFAAVLGAVSGILIAPINLLTPNMMQSVLLYAFAAVVLGGMGSPVGAVVAGLALGVTLNLLGTYVDFVTPELKLPLALGVLLTVLIVKPSGLFGKPEVRRA